MISTTTDIPVAICIGAQKAGTTWLYKCLEEHPEVHVSKEKEPHYFSDRYDRIDHDDYLAMLVDQDATINFESSVSYLAHPRAAERIADTFPHARLIVILRNPIDRTISHLKHLRAKQKLQGEPLTTARVTYPDLIENSLYGQHLTRYLAIFPREQILILDYDRLTREPQALMDEVCTFLHLSSFTPSLLEKKYHSSAARAHPLYMWVARRYKRNRTNPLFRAVVRVLKKVGITGVTLDTWFSAHKKTNTTPEQVLTKTERTELQTTYTADLKKLEQLIGPLPAAVTKHIYD